MIALQRPSPVPAVLLNEGALATARDIAAVRSDLVAYRSGAKTLDFERDVYGHPAVKGTLVRMQRGKCAFCESSFRAVAFGDVEHFRPKGGFRQRRSDPLRRPGYYWLAYAWDNLLVSCELCNRRHKRNHFPLEKGSPRARGPSVSCARERPRLIDPTREDPRDTITWHEHRAVALAGDLRGRVTIRVLGLNRATLRTRRRERLDVVSRILDMVEEHPRNTPEKQRAEDWLRAQARPDAEYSAMVRAYLTQRGFALS